MKVDPVLNYVSLLFLFSSCTAVVHQPHTPNITSVTHYEPSEFRLNLSISSYGLNYNQLFEQKHILLSEIAFAYTRNFLGISNSRKKYRVGCAYYSRVNNPFCIGVNVAHSRGQQIERSNVFISQQLSYEQWIVGTFLSREYHKYKLRIRLSVEYE